MSEFERTDLVLGQGAVEKLKGKHVAVFGLGGVGGYVAEALARCGLGELTVVDSDVVSPSNVNRQILALHSTIGIAKTEVCKQRLSDINPTLKVNALNMFFLPENKGEMDFTEFDYVADAVDTITAKLTIIECCKAVGVKVISCMGTGNKTDPTKFKVADIEKTSVCPLAKVMRRELKKRGISGVKVVYSEEDAIKQTKKLDDSLKRVTIGSVAFVPSVAGLIMAGEIVKDLLK